MPPRHRALALLLLAGAAGCVGALALSCAPPARHEARVSSEADLAAIGKLRESYVAAHNDADASRLSGLWADDAVFMPMDEPTLTGKEAIRDHFQDFFDQVPSVIAVNADETVVAGDWAFERGTETVTMDADQGREAVRMTVKYLSILRRQPDGSWKYARYIYNLDEERPVPQAPTPAK